MKIGLIYTSYGCKEYLDGSLGPWLELKKELGDDLLIASVSVPFKEYEGWQDEDEQSGTYLLSVSDYVVLDPKYIQEHEARNIAFQWLKKEKVDYYWLWDGDELTSVDEIKRMIRFVKNNYLNTWFKISYKNYIWDKNHYLSEVFAPPRIFSSSSYFDGIKVFAHRIAWDNDVVYHDDDGHIQFQQSKLSNIVIPSAVACPKHYTWLNDIRSKNKIKYQEAHFSHGAGCSYKWNEKTQSVEFNEEFYKKTGQAKPDVVKDLSET